MSYRDILVQADQSEASAQRSALASRLAKRFGAHLTGVFLRTSFPSQYFATGGYGGMAPVILPELVTQHEQAVEKASEEARLSFEAAAAKASTPSSWLSVHGDTPAAMLECMRRTDLTVVPRDHGDDFGDLGFSPGQLGLGSGGPMLVVPGLGPDAPVGRRVLVAWNGRREAARALRDAWPFIAGADEVFVLVVSPHGVGGPDGMLQRYLERHDCKPAVIVDRSDDASAGRILREHIDTLKADLVVMGLYGRARLQELVLGGVSRELLRTSPVPLLVSH